MNILLTNDDGYRSPLFINFAKLLKEESWITSLTLVAPSQEQSWIGSAITTHFDISYCVVDYEGLKIHTLSGTPSDCTMIGAHHISDTTPDLVLSGINFGTNAGSAFCISSGTLAAARQAALIGIPGFAFSALLKEEVRQGWKRKDFEFLKSHSTYLNDLALYHRDLLRICYNKGYFEKKNKFEYASINSPLNLDCRDLVNTGVKDTKYKDFFYKLNDNTFKHSFVGFKEDESFTSMNNISLPKDIDILSSGSPTITFFNVLVGDMVPTI